MEDLPAPELNFPELGDGEADFSSPVLCATLDGGDPTPSIPACLLAADPGDLSQTEVVQIFEYKVYPVDPGWRFR